MEEKKYDEVIEIDIRGMVFALLNRSWMICLVAITFAMALYFYGKYNVTPVYESETKIYILNPETESIVTYNDLQVGASLTKDYKELITCRPVIEEVISVLALDTTYNALVGKISVTIPVDTRIITIKVTDIDPVRAMKIANTLRESASEHIENVMNIESVNIVEEAIVPEAPSNSSAKRYGIIGGALGVLLVSFVTVVQFILDDTIKSSDVIERKLGLTNLATIPLTEDNMSKRRRILKCIKRFRAARKKRHVKE